MVISIFISLFLFSATVLIHFYVLYTTSKYISKASYSIFTQLILLVSVVIFAHSIEVILYASSYYLMNEVFFLGHLAGDFQNQKYEYIYYSIVSYTSLGLGDVWPHGSIRLVTGVEAINGLFLIGWSIMFTYPTLKTACSLEPK